jgi:hypothetical protein
VAHQWGGADPVSSSTSSATSSCSPVSQTWTEICSVSWEEKDKIRKNSKGHLPSRPRRLPVHRDPTPLPSAAAAAAATATATVGFATQDKVHVPPSRGSQQPARAPHVSPAHPPSRGCPCRRCRPRYRPAEKLRIGGRREVDAAAEAPAGRAVRRRRRRSPGWHDRAGKGAVRSAAAAEAAAATAYNQLADVVGLGVRRGTVGAAPVVRESLVAAVTDGMTCLLRFREEIGWWWWWVG